MKLILGEQTSFSDDNAYIKIDLDKGTWERTFTYQWLYRKPPELKSIEDVFGYIKIYKRKEKLNSILES